jgi:hypothetical protein
MAAGAPMTKGERDRLLADEARLLAERRTALEKRDLARSRVLLAQAKAASEEYFDRLPIVTVSTCPYCDRLIQRSFDPYGLDGRWWAPDAPRRMPEPCRHYCMIRGAVNFNNKLVIGGDFDVYAGPEVPYVIPRILSMESMVAVIGELPMTPGFTAYPIVYFAERRPPVQELAADWPAKIHSYTTALGEPGWKFDIDPWDFELAPWLASGKLRWCQSDSNNEALSTAPPDQCPYLNLKGRREMMVVNRLGAMGRGVPDGQPILPIDD